METTALTFGAPVWLWGTLVLPLLGFLYAWSQYRGRALVAKVVAPRLLGQLAGSVSIARRVLRAILMLAVFASVLIALAQPRYGFTQQEIKQKGRDIVVAIDTSRSMLATDVAPNRLTRAKLLTQDLVRLMKGDRIGLIAFAGSAFLQAPLTLDYTAVINSLGELDTNVIPKGGTDIAAAIATAEEAFGKAEGHTRAMIIMTDGEELDADGIAAAKKAASHGIRIFTVGIGSPDGSLIPIRTDEGRQDFVRDASGKPVQSRLDENRLKEIANATGGFYVPIGADAAKEIFQKGIEPMDLAETGAFGSRQPIERYQWPLGFATGFLVIWLLVGERRRLRNGTFKRLAAAAFIIGACSLPAQAASTGLQEFQNGQYDKARQAFEQRLKSTPGSREIQFDAGASAYKMGDFEQAVAHFTSALLSENKKLREDSAYNLGNSLVRRGEASKDNKAKKADWKNAIEQYTEALAIDPKNKQATENRDIVKKLLEDLEKQEKQQEQKKDQKDQDKKDQKDQQNKDQKDQQNKDQKDQDKKDQKDQQNKDQKDQQNKDQKDQDKKDQKDQQNKDQKDQQNKDQKDQDKKDQQQPSSPNQPQNKEPEKAPKPVPTPTPGEKKQGEVKAANGQEKKDEKKAQQEAAAAAGEKEKDGEMSAAQARALLNALRSEEQKVNLIPQQPSQDVIRDW